ncbi:MAG TPA: DUF3501 family protein [Candidatus Kapabacteria bacterium]|nr:DUF3501 family protein [Candidatus Kapabacteria bacterium]
MRPIQLTDLKNIAEYEKERPAIRKKVIEAKRHRRIHVGPLMTFVFENRMTVLFQIQEMMRTERLVHDEYIQHEIDTYNKILPGPNELSATLLIEITEKEKIKSTLDSLVGLTEHAVFLMIGDKEIEAEFDEEQSEEGRISAVQYIRFKLDTQEVERMRFGQADVTLMVRHPNYQDFTRLTDEQRDSIVKDVDEE